MKYLYAIKNILVIILIVSFFLSITSKSVFAVSSSGDIDLYDYYLQTEFQAQRQFVAIIYRWMAKYHTLPNTLRSLADDLKTNSRIAYFYNINNGNLCARSSHYVNGDAAKELTIYVFDSSDFVINSDSFQAGVWFPGISAGVSGDMTYPCYKLQAKKGMICYLNSSNVGNSFYSNADNQSYYDTTAKSNIPRGTVVYCDELQQLFDDYYEGKLQEQATNPDLITLLKEMGEEEEQQTEDLDQIKNDINETKNFIKDTNKSVDTNLPSSSGANDPTSSGFNNIFMRFYNAMTSDSASDIITVPIPYANRSFDLNPIYVRSWWNSLGVIKDMVSAVWYFLVGLYIAKDIHKIIHDIQDGSIMTKTDTDIKTEML